MNNAEILLRIESKFDTLLKLLDNSLGPCSPPAQFFLYIKKIANSSWYYRENNNNIPFNAEALNGVVTNLKIHVLENEDFGECEKLELNFQSDRNYIIRSGLTTVFSKQLLLRLDVVKDLSRPLIICPIPGDKEVVFCNLYDGVTLAPIMTEEKSAPKDFDAKLYVNRIANRLHDKALEEPENGQKHVNGCDRVQTL